MWRSKTYRLKSSCPLIMHNGQLADPLNKFSKAMKQVSGKRNKTEADHEEMAHIEFLGGLYVGEKGPVLPTSMIEAALIGAAKKFKEGNQAKAGMYVADNAYLEYDGPKDPEELYKLDKFRDMRGVVISRSRIMRTRPIFSEWEATVTVSFEDTVINGGRIDEWVKTAGNIIGLGEMRPRYGRFEVV